MTSSTARQHISYSFLSKMDVCPLSWWGKYHLDLPERRSGPQFVGLMVHDVIDRVHRGLVPLNIKQIIDDFETGWKDQRCFPRQPDEQIDWFSIDWGLVQPRGLVSQETRTIYEDRCEVKAREFFNHGWHLLKMYFSGPHLRNQPLTVNGDLMSEFQINVDLSGYGGKQLKELVCRIDMLTAKGIIDFKTKFFKKIPQSQFITDLQPVIYAFALDELGMVDPPIDFRYAQLVYGQGYEYDDSVGGKVPRWKIDAFRQSVLPARLETAERYLEIAASDPSWFKGSVRPGSHCAWCEVRQSCPWMTEHTTA